MQIRIVTFLAGVLATAIAFLAVRRTRVNGFSGPACQQAGCFREKKTKKTVRRIASACGLIALYFGTSSAHAFCTEFDILGIGVNCVDEGHKRVTGNIKPILRGSVWSAIWDGNYAQDNPLGDFRNDGQR